MSIRLAIDDYNKHTQNAKHIVLEHIVGPPKGALGALGINPKFPSFVIPPLNTNIQFSSTLPRYQLSKHPGLAALDHTLLPEKFNWREDGGEKTALISQPGNQMLCGSCWAISAAGIVADNHVVAGTVNWKPNLSTTWSLSNYPQSQCKGGNPATLLQDISEHGISTDHCVDYSWCSESNDCNGKATAHFEQKDVNLSELIPDEGCYDSKVPHYMYYIDSPETISLGDSGMNSDTFTNTVKKHIYYNGPVQGGFLVFKNFMKGPPGK